MAVIEGVVRVDSGESTSELRAGDQATSGASVQKVPIRNEISWSRNSAQYLALLGDFAILQKQIAAIPGPGLRYISGGQCNWGEKQFTESSLRSLIWS